MSSCKTVVVVGDIHEGNRGSATPPQWQTPFCSDFPEKNKFAIMQREEWKWLKREISKLPKVDILISNGDSIDGNGIKSGGTELIITDRYEQSKAAATLIKEFNPKKIYMTHGTSGHSGCDEDWESLVAEELGCEIKDHLFLNINGLVFDIKHHISGSSCTCYCNNLLKEFDMNMRQNICGNQPLSDIIIRSHRHYYVDVSGIRPNTKGFITPSLCGPGSKFGNRKCNQLVNFGFIVFSITNKNKWSCDPCLAQIESHIMSTQVV